MKMGDDYKIVAANVPLTAVMTNEQYRSQVIQELIEKALGRISRCTKAP